MAHTAGLSEMFFAADLRSPTDCERRLAEIRLPAIRRIGELSRGSEGNYAPWTTSAPSQSLFPLWPVRMANIFSAITPETIFGYVCRIVADPLKSTSNEDKVQVAEHQF
jgi:hypothetical protein